MRRLPPQVALDRNAIEEIRSERKGSERKLVWQLVLRVTLRATGEGFYRLEWWAFGMQILATHKCLLP